METACTLVTIKKYMPTGDCLLFNSKVGLKGYLKFDFYLE